ncbi:MAG: AraC family transcriptional regulator ligand-binding domain-containing protein [Comamonadaceae bacterium]|nr:AraC family transcriptional regulator ligand-binding domain-containing protein [Comamonadaceae bacterium]
MHRCPPTHHAPRVTPLLYEHHRCPPERGCAAGRDRTAPLQLAQIPPVRFIEADGRMTARQMEVLSGAAMQELDDEGLGAFSRRLPWGSYGMLARASLSAPDLSAALAAGVARRPADRRHPVERGERRRAGRHRVDEHADVRRRARVHGCCTAQTSTVWLVGTWIRAFHRRSPLSVPGAALCRGLTDPVHSGGQFWHPAGRTAL